LVKNLKVSLSKTGWGVGDDLGDFVWDAQKPTVDFSFRQPLKIPD